MRLFVGIDLPDEAKEELHRLTVELQRVSSAGSFVPEENVHLTLAFVGETKRVDDVKTALALVVSNYRAHPLTPSPSVFDLGLCGIGSFKQKKGHTWWVGVREDDGLRYLRVLQGEITRELIHAGFNLEKRSYKPHITLARSVTTHGPVYLEFPSLNLEVREFCLFSSHSEHGRQVYTPLEVYTL